MLNQSADHSLRAVLYVAQHDAVRSCTVATIADAIDAPRNYLGKVLNALMHAGVLTSLRGPRGGFRLARPPEETTLEDVIEPFQRMPEREICLLGNRPCTSSNPCGAHRRWQAMSDEVTAFFRRTTIADLLNGGVAVPEGRQERAAGEQPTGVVRPLQLAGRTS